MLGNAKPVLMADSADTVPSEPYPSVVALPDSSSEDSAFKVFIDSLDYLPKEDIARIRSAYKFSKKAHRWQKRATGEAYITHPLAVAGEIAEWRLDAEAISAALLHDVIEDAKIKKEELAKKFGANVAELVDGLSKLDKLKFRSRQEAQAENLLRMLGAAKRDLRVILIKLSDRLHNLQTMSALRPDKRRRIARETLEIYVPIANRLGLNDLYLKLQDLCFRNIYPKRAEILEHALKIARGDRRELMSQIQKSIEQRITEENITAEILEREKSLDNIYRKMALKRLPFSQALDVYGFRVIVRDRLTCYLTLGILHALYTPVPGKFKDYIAIPKANGYQSLHTTLIGPEGRPVEIQIRTEEMHRIARAGIASNWLSNQANGSGDELQVKIRKWLESLLKSLLELKTTADSTYAFLVDELPPDAICVFTPKGREITLPRGATVVDFAYAVHTDIGHRCIGALIDHEPVPLRTELSNGKQVEILTATLPNPKLAWLSFVKTGNARSKIRHYLKNRRQEELATVGEFLLSQALHALNVNPDTIPSASWDQVLRNTKAKTQKEIYIDIAMRRRHETVVAHRLLANEHATATTPVPALRMTIIGSEDMAIELASCCHPVPGDVIVGLLKKGQGLVVHTDDCLATVKSRRRNSRNWIEVDWAAETNQNFNVRICVLARNQPGVLAQVSAAIANNDANITDVHLDDGQDKLYATLRFLIQVTDRQHLAQIIEQLSRLPAVKRIARDRDRTITDARHNAL